jgi:flagellar biosynthesis/type III secretory pathway M-ring protein FliF/YscJ
MSDGLEMVWQQALLGVGLSLLAIICVFAAVWFVRKHRDRRRRAKSEPAVEAAATSAQATPVRNETGKKERKKEKQKRFVVLNSSGKGL